MSLSGKSLSEVISHILQGQIINEDNTKLQVISNLVFDSVEWPRKQNFSLFLVLLLFREPLEHRVDLQV